MQYWKKSGKRYLQARRWSADRVELVEQLSCSTIFVSQEQLDLEFEPERTVPKPFISRLVPFLARPQSFVAELQARRLSQLQKARHGPNKSPRKTKSKPRLKKAHRELLAMVPPDLRRATAIKLGLDPDKVLDQIGPT